MPGVIGPTNTNRRGRRTNPRPNQPQPTTPILITASVAALTVLTLTFDQQVLLNGTPAFTTNLAGASPLSAVKAAPNQVAITFDADISLAATVNIGHRDPAIRNASGGYVTSSVVTI